jgi:O-antigen/teichoic acid export membrane protein
MLNLTNARFRFHLSNYILRHSINPSKSSIDEEHNFESGRPLRKEAVKVLSSMGALFGNRLLSMAIPLLTFPIIVRSLSAVQYGNWSYAQTCVALFAMVANPGLIQFVSREISANPAIAPVVLPRIRGLQCALAGVSYTALLGFIQVVGSQAELQWMVAILGLTIITNATVGSDWLLFSLQEFRIQALCATISQVTFATAVVVLLGIFGFSWALPVFTVVSGAVSMGVALVYLKRTRGIHPRISFSTTEWVYYLRVSVSFGAASAMSMIYQRIDFLMIESWLGSESLGHYAAAYKLVEIMQSFILIGTSMMVPPAARILRSDAAGLSTMLRDCIVVAVIVLAPIVAGGSFCASGIVSICLGPSYANDSLLLAVLFWILPAGVAAAMLSGCCLYAAGHAKKMMVATSLAAAVNVLLNLALIPSIGVIGAAMATIAAQATVALSSYFMCRKKLACVFAPASLLPIAAACFMVALLSAVSDSVGYLPVQICIGIVAYICALWALNSVTNRSLTRAMINAERLLR